MRPAAEGGEAQEGHPAGDAPDLGARPGREAGDPEAFRGVGLLGARPLQDGAPP